MSKPVKLIIIGAGSRGTIYASYAKYHPDKAVVTAVAEPDNKRRVTIAKNYSLADDKLFKDWPPIIKKAKFADAVIIATQDREHAEAAIAFAYKGYNILLEKPISPNEEDCKRTVKAALENRIIFAVCHVLRYTPLTIKLKELIQSGCIGRIVTLQHLEPVGYWHQAHSFVRGNWRNSLSSSPMLLSKSCHDLDWIRYIIGGPCLKISSFGNLNYFKSENKPENASSRCIDCQLEPNCPYSAKKLYMGKFLNGQCDWPLDVIAFPVTLENLTIALKESRYGRCVFDCDNNVVDHQIVNMEFDRGITASFTMTAFVAEQNMARKTRIFGTNGEIYVDGSEIVLFDFLTDKREVFRFENKSPNIGTLLSGHGGGDYEIMKTFTKAVKKNNPQLILSGPEESLETHLMVFNAEKARQTNSVVLI